MERDVQFENWDGTVLSNNVTVISLDSKAFSQATFCEIGTPHHYHTEDNGTQRADGEQLQG